MNAKKKIQFISEKLDELFPNPPIPLDHTDAYTMLVAVVLSAQCTDIRVNQVTKVPFSFHVIPESLITLSFFTFKLYEPCFHIYVVCTVIHISKSCPLDRLCMAKVPYNIQMYELSQKCFSFP